MKKIVVFAVSGDSHFKNPVTKSFQKKGFKVILFDYRKNNLLEKVVFALTKLFPRLSKLPIYLRNKRLVNEIRRNQASILFVSKGELISKESIEEIKKLGVVTINWFSDLFEYVPFMKKIFPSYDFVFTHDRDRFNVYKKTINLFYLPYGAPVTKKPNYIKRSYNIVFIGHLSPEREEMILSLQKFKPVVWGYDSWATSKVKEFYQGKSLLPDEVLEVLHKTKIAINVHQVPYTDGTTLNVRAFEATSSGAMLLTDRRRDLARLFKITGPKKEVVMYKNFKELKKLVEYYLTHDQERISIAKRGFNRANKEYNYDTKIEEILKIVNSSTKA
jgi:spore maturation protein CgeB